MPSDQWPWGRFTIDEGAIGWINSNDSKAHAVTWQGSDDLEAVVSGDTGQEATERVHRFLADTGRGDWKMFVDIFAYRIMAGLQSEGAQAVV